jgi:hypothetical protein
LESDARTKLLETDAKTKLLEAEAMLMAKENKIMLTTWRPCLTPSDENGSRIGRR